MMRRREKLIKRIVAVSIILINLLLAYVVNQLPTFPNIRHKNVIVFGSFFILSLALIWLTLLQEEVSTTQNPIPQHHNDSQLKRRDILNVLGLISISGTSIIAYRIIEAWIMTWADNPPENPTPTITLSPDINPKNQPTPETPNPDPTAEPTENIHPPLKESSFVFDIVEVDKRGKVITRQSKATLMFVESLGSPFNLELLSIPAGSFTMGASIGEEGRQDDRRSSIKDGPPHNVTVQSFLLGKYPVTQDLWEYVSQLPRVEINLDPAPSYYEGKRRPVERVSWYEAMEFCARISKQTNREYRLPSEAEWEYACRAGTTSPFYFGETITTDLSNFDGLEDSYGEAPLGVYREETVEVGLFPPNAYGLYDMHGNVWEWCADHFHETYEGSPSNSRAWKSSMDDAPRILRGGSWYNTPHKCRSAHRTYLSPENEGTLSGNSIGSVGFRVACSSPL